MFRRSFTVCESSVLLVHTLLSLVVPHSSLLVEADGGMIILVNKIDSFLRPLTVTQQLLCTVVSSKLPGCWRKSYTLSWQL